MSNDERAKLRTMLSYWIEHNEEHSQEFREWADKAKALGETEAAEDILQAAQEIAKANEFLSRSLTRLGGKGG